MAMVAAALRLDGTRLITARSSIFWNKCMHLARIIDQSYANKFNLSLKRTTPSMGSLRAHHTFKFNNAYKKPDAGHFERHYTSAAKFSTARTKEKQGDAESSYTKKGDGPVKIGDNTVSYFLSTQVSHSVINAQTVKDLCLETEPTPPTTVTLMRQSCTCDTKCVVEWRMGNKTFTWTFLVAPLKWDIILGVDWMNHVSPLDLQLDKDSKRTTMTIFMPEGIRWWLD